MKKDIIKLSLLSLFLIIVSTIIILLFGRTYTVVYNKIDYKIN